MRGWTMMLSAAAGLYGAAGVALAAAGAHRSAGPLTTTAAYFLLFHAAAIVGLCASVRPEAGRGVKIAASLIAVGALLFSGELSVHALVGVQPLPFAAPAGGILMVLGWLTTAVALPLTIRQRA